MQELLGRFSPEKFFGVGSMGNSRKARAGKQLVLPPRFLLAKRYWKRVRDTVRPLAPDLVRQGLKAALGFVVAAVVVGFIRDPFEQNVIPWFIRKLSLEQALYIYTDPSGSADDQYDFLVPRLVLASGRMIQDRAVAERDNRKNNPRNFKVKGSRSGDLLMFTYISSTDKLGMGAFVGRRLDTDNDDIFIGNLTGWGHGKDGHCTIVSYWAVIGPAKEKQRFDDLLKNSVGGAAPAKATTSDASLKCSEPKG
ncbi:hypothetical protein A5906_30670 [Bradyrhizobium sacchari]|uniref:Uncharacterized protein n=1 Tax=Bradyrhizobium sacchari TaxID=1399419 RepID=A0A560JRL8_9BRAD|nr:hypothetical protein [Bradyrhizobium sacchari]OPY98923.1 hypothetical protein A5906_30670 [Bradyrhizobium sacchari]TWB60407.1 hypothetical protein FBZ94_104632 [Bradyrhizobium sacchari]TWB73783.1 hypothetical protein FBZ95_10533 [Bradyrhizobium sacchari]